MGGLGHGVQTENQGLRPNHQPANQSGSYHYSLARGVGAERTRTAANQRRRLLDLLGVLCGARGTYRAWAGHPRAAQRGQPALQRVL